MDTFTDYIKLLYSSKGKISRLMFIRGCFLTLFASIIFYFMLLMIFSTYRVFFDDNMSFIAQFLLLSVFIILFLPSTIILSIKRLHDLGKSGFYTLLLFLPVINIILFLILILNKGETVKDNYDDESLGNLNSDILPGKRVNGIIKLFSNSHEKAGRVDFLLGILTTLILSFAVSVCYIYLAKFSLRFFMVTYTNSLYGNLTVMIVGLLMLLLGCVLVISALCFIYIIIEKRLYTIGISELFIICPVIFYIIWTTVKLTTIYFFTSFIVSHSVSFGLISLFVSLTLFIYFLVISALLIFK